jgi:hypothetical protein
LSGALTLEMLEAARENLHRSLRKTGEYVKEVGAAAMRASDAMNQLGNAFFGMPFGMGMRIVEEPLLTETANIARSPSRALRRWRTGKRKVSPFGEVPKKSALIVGDTIILHPVQAQLLRAKVKSMQARGESI